MLLPLTFLGFTLWKPRHFGSLVSPAMRPSLWASHSHRRLVGGLSVFYRFLSGLVPPALSAICPHHISAGCSSSANNPFLVKLPKSRIPAHLHTFILLFSCLWNKLPHSLQSHSSLQAFKSSCSPPPLITPHPNPRSFLPPLIHPKPTSFKFPAFLPESPCNVHLVFPMFPVPSLSLPQIS